MTPELIRDLDAAKRHRSEQEQALDTRRRKLHADGYSDIQIARALGGSQLTVRNWRQRAGLPSNRSGVSL